jgi:hypothetical protein
LRRQARLQSVESGSQPRRLLASEPGVVAASVYANGRWVADIPIEEAGDWSKKTGHVVWIGLHEPGMELLERVAAHAGFHSLNSGGNRVLSRGCGTVGINDRSLSLPKAAGPMNFSPGSDFFPQCSASSNREATRVRIDPASAANALGDFAAD